MIFLRGIFQECSIKWPNDIYVNNDKIAGILIENSIMGDNIEYTIAGIGININQDKFLKRCSQSGFAENADRKGI